MVFVFSYFFLTLLQFETMEFCLLVILGNKTRSCNKDINDDFAHYFSETITSIIVNIHLSLYFKNHLFGTEHLLETILLNRC